jgi:tetratricopeptide (TPR) repeat protein
VPRILLAEPHEATRALVRERLASSGLEVLVVDEAELSGRFAAERPDAVVLAADVAEAEPLARQLRQADPRLLLLVIDKEHLGKARGLQAVLPLRANGYVADPTGPELGERLARLLAQQAAARARLRGVAQLLSRAPAARGELRMGVAARLLHQIWRSLSEGVLVLSGTGPERRLYFLRGVPVAAESDDPGEGLVGWLAATGRLEPATRQAVEAAMSDGLTPGAALIAAGLLEAGEPLQAALGSHLRWLLARAVDGRAGSWRFHAGDEFAAQLQLVEVLPLQPILEGARAHLPVKHFADALKAVLQAFPTRTQDFDQLVPPIGLGAHDLALATSLDGRRSTRAVLEGHKTELKEVLSLLWFLSMIGALVFHETAADAAGGPERRGRPPLPADRAEAIRQAALRILPGSYFHALGVDIAVDAAEAEAAWREVAARFDPASFAEYEVGDLADLLKAVQEKVTAAHRVLSSDEKRRHYLAFLLLKSEQGGARASGIVPDAEVALKRGERALRARRNAEAVSALTEAVELNPREPAYLAMLAFAELHDPVLPPRVRADEARSRARAALALDPGHLRALVALALAEHLAGDGAAARRVIDEALHLHPGAELVRQVHLRLRRLAAAPG